MLFSCKYKKDMKAVGKTAFYAKYGKLEKYAAYGVMMNAQDAVIFSFRYKSISVTKPSCAGTVYSRAGVSYVLERMKEHGLTDARQLLRLYPEDVFLREFLVLCGAARVKDGCITLRQGINIDETFLKKFIFSLKFHVNGYVLKELNKRQSILAKNRLAQFVALLYGWTMGSFRAYQAGCFRDSQYIS